VPKHLGRCSLALGTAIPCVSPGTAQYSTSAARTWQIARPTCSKRSSPFCADNCSKNDLVWLWHAPVSAPGFPQPTSTGTKFQERRIITSASLRMLALPPSRTSEGTYRESCYA